MTYENIRTIGDAPIPWKSDLVVLILITPQYMRASTRKRGDKEAILQLVTPNDTLLVAWPGQYRQDIFLVDPEALEKARIAIG